MPLVNTFRQHKRATMAALLAGICIFLCGCAQKEPEPKVYHIGVLEGVPFFANTTNGLKAGMAELGYVEGKNIMYDVQSSPIDLERYRRILRKFVDDKVDLIFSFPTEASLEAKAAAQEAGIPVIFSIVNVEGNDLIRSIREPGGNITGVRYPGPGLAIKRLEILQELVPDVQRIVVCYNKSYPVVPGQLEILRLAMESMGLTLIEVPAKTLAELQSGLDALTAGGVGVDAVLLIDGPHAVTPESFKIIAQFASDRNVPIGGMTQSVDGFETLYGVSIDTFATGKKAAILMGKVLGGTPPGTIPVMSSETFLTINYREAQRLGINVTEGLLNRADKIIR